MAVLGVQIRIFIRLEKIKSRYGQTEISVGYSVGCPFVEPKETIIIIPETNINEIKRSNVNEGLKYGTLSCERVTG